MNERQKELLRILLVNSNQFYRVEELSEKLKCSEKTIRNDCHKIEVFLKPYKESTLIRKPGVGISLDITKEVQTELFRDLYQTESQTKEERIIEIAYYLLTSAEPITLKTLAERYYTNSAHIKVDLETIDTWLTRFNLKIKTRQRIGSIIEGTELNKRSAIAHLSELVSEYEQRNYVLDFFPASEINAVKKVIQDMQIQYNLELTDGGFESLIIHALIMIRRTRQNYSVLISSVEIEETLYTWEYEIAIDLLTKLESIIRLRFPENERIYYAWHILSSIRNKEAVPGIDHSHQLVEKMVADLITNLHQLTLIRFDQDQVLVDGLIIHFDAVLKRISYGFHITNPMMNDIKKMYPYLFSMTLFALNAMRDTEGISIPEEEAAYLVLHFQASIERMEQRQSPKRVLIVCHMGIGMSRLLQAKLEQQYKGLTIIDCIAKNELTSFNKHTPDIDLIISTVPLKHETIPYVVISPLLESQDKAKLNTFLQEDHTSKVESSYPTLMHFIDKGFFQKNINLDHPFKIVEMLANQLVRLELVEPSFTHSALLRERASFTSIGGGIAIPHAEPETVKESTISMVVLPNPIKWGSELVSIIFLLAIKKEERMLTKDLIKEIMLLSEQPKLLSEFNMANKKVDILKIIS